MLESVFTPESQVSRVKRVRKRAHQAGLPATLTVDDWMAILKECNYVCAFCHAPYKCIDVPDAKGVTPDTCLPACNECHHERMQLRNALRAVHRSAARGNLMAIKPLVMQLFGEYEAAVVAEHQAKIANANMDLASLNAFMAGFELVSEGAHPLGIIGGDTSA